MTDKELMQQALEALEQVVKYFNVDSTETKTITALRERLAQPDPVPYWRSEFLKHNTTSEQPAQQYSATSDHRLMENAQGELERITLVQTGVGIGNPKQKTCLVANEPCKHGSWCSEVYCQEHCKFVEQPAQQQEPVAWQERQAKRMRDGVVTEWTPWYPCRYRTIDEAKSEACDHIPYEWRPLYTSPPASKPWVGLTDEERDECVDAADEASVNKPLIFWSEHHYDAIEAKLREKNA